MNTHLLFSYFQNMSHYFWALRWMKNVNNFQIAKVQPHGLPQHLLDFCQFQPDVTYKSVACKKVRTLFKIGFLFTSCYITKKLNLGKQKVFQTFFTLMGCLKAFEESTKMSKILQKNQKIILDMQQPYLGISLSLTKLALLCYCVDSIENMDFFPNTYVKSSLR